MAGHHPLKVLEVTWLDAEADAGWSHYSREELEKNTKEYKTVGLLVDQNKDWYVLASTKCPHRTGYWSELMRIPKRMVLRKRIVGYSD